MIKTAKFGGSSLANHHQFRKVFNIINSDKTIHYVIVSAIGKENDDDTKMTDLLIELANKKYSNQDYKNVYDNIINKHQKIIKDLGLSVSILHNITDDLQKRLNSNLSREKYFDLIKSFGEDCSAKILSEFCSLNNLKSCVMSPVQLGINLVKENQTFKISNTSYQNVFNALLNITDLVIIPGFYGIDEDGDIITFARGGSDLTGAIIASSIKCDIYENYTDVDNVFVASPKIVKDPPAIKSLTYKEIRELSYGGFQVLHEETILPLYKKDIKIHIKNTNNPSAPGTLIASSHEHFENPVTGITGRAGFLSIYVQKYLMNREVGFVHRLLAIFEREQVPFEHLPSGIDYISIIVDSNTFYSKNYQKIIAEIKSQLDVDYLKIIDGLGLVVIVGENIATRNVLSRSINALKVNNIQVLNLSLAELGDSLIIGVDQSALKDAIKVLYSCFFEDDKNW